MTSGNRRNVSPVLSWSRIVPPLPPIDRSRAEAFARQVRQGLGATTMRAIDVPRPVNQAI